MTNRIFFDTEFIDNGSTVDLISIGLVKESGQSLYLESSECDLSKACPWVREHVIPQLNGLTKTRVQMQEQILDFVGGEKPEFWAYFAAYDWVALSQLFGRMIDVPKGWPMYCNNIVQLCNQMGSPKLPKQVIGHHKAIDDARWNLETYNFLIDDDANKFSDMEDEQRGYSND